MKKIITLINVFLLSGLIYSQNSLPVYEQLITEVNNLPDVSDKIKQLIKDTLLPLSLNPVIISEVKAQNAKKFSPEDIKKTDEEWINAEDELPVQAEKLNGLCAKELKAFAAANKMVAEIFVMDNQGANVGLNSLTSDYWQGDEPKWQKSFNEGKGGIFVDKEKLDKSTNIVTQQVSFPVFDENGTVIGAVCCGININLL